MSSFSFVLWLLVLAAMGYLIRRVLTRVRLRRQRVAGIAKFDELIAEAQKRRYETRPNADYTPRARLAHGLALRAPGQVPPYRRLDEVPTLDDPQQIELLIDDPETAATELIEVDIASGAIVRRHPTSTVRCLCPATWRDDAPYLLGASKMIEPSPRLELIVDYPLEGPFAFTLEAGPGFTRLELAAQICEVYEHIYEVEARTTTIPVGSAGELDNRNRTNGTFAIYGHALPDLEVELVLIGTVDGQRWVVLQVGS